MFAYQEAAGAPLAAVAEPTQSTLTAHSNLRVRRFWAVQRISRLMGRPPGTVVRVLDVRLRRLIARDRAGPQRLK